MIHIDSEAPEDGAAIEQLLDVAFGPGRYAKSAYRLREGVPPLAALSYVAREGRAVRGSIRYWPVLIGGCPALMLGPLAVDPALRGQGIGIGLMMRSLSRARALGHRLVMLVGDEPYYARVGFRAVAPGLFTFPGPVDETRLLMRELVPGTLCGLSGAITSARAAIERATLAAAEKSIRPRKKSA